MGSYRYEILRETTTDSLIMENNTREKKMNSNVYGIDLGTCNMKIYCKTSNKILNEKNTIALVKKDQIYAYGDAAYAMYEKAPETINVTFPVISGVIADFNNLQTMLQMYLEEHMKGKIRVKKSERDLYYAVKTIKAVGEDALPMLVQKREDNKKKKKNPSK